MTTERFVIQVEERGAVKVTNEIRNIGTEAKKSSDSLGLLRGALAGISAGLIFRSLSNLTSVFTDLNSRATLAAGGTERGAVAMNRLREIADRAYASLESIAEVYLRNTLVLDDLQISMGKQLDFTEAVTNALVVSGARGQQLESTITALSNAMQVGVLRGQNWNSVLANGGRLIQALSDGLGVGVAELRQMGTSGQLTSEAVFGAIVSQLETLRAEADEMPATVVDAFVRLRNAVLALSGAFDQATGFTDFFVSVINRATGAAHYLRENTDALKLAIAGLGVPALTAQILVLIRVVNALSVAVFKLIAANPIILFLSLLSGAIAMLVMFRNEIMISETGFATLGDVLAEVGTEIMSVLQDIALVAAEVFGGLEGLLDPLTGEIDLSIASILTSMAQFADRFVGFYVGMVRASIASFRQLGPAIQDLAISGVNGMVRAYEVAIRSVQALVIEVIASLGTAVRQVGIGIQNLAEAGRQALAGNTTAAKEFADNAAFFISNAAEQGFRSFTDRVAARFDELDSEKLLNRLYNPSEGAAEKLGETFVTQFMEGFNRTNIQDSVGGILARAEERARARAGLDDGSGGGVDDEAGGVRVDQKRITALQEINDKLDQQARLLRLTNRERQIATDLAAIESDLIKSNITLTDQELAQFDVKLRNLQALEDQARLLDEIRGPQEELMARQAALNALYSQGRISAGEYAEGLRDIQRASLETDKTLSGGFERGLMRIGDTLINFSDQAEATVVNAFGAAEDALVSFVTTGEADFGRMIDSILADLTRLLARQALFGLLGLGGTAGNGGGGGLGGILGSLFGGFRADGGSVDPGQAYVVGERGREIFVPDQPGTIIPNNEIGTQPAPQVNVSVVNVTDPDEIAAAMADPNVQDRIVNVIARNRSAVKTALGV